MDDSVTALSGEINTGIGGVLVLVTALFAFPLVFMAPAASAVIGLAMTGVAAWHRGERRLRAVRLLSASLGGAIVMASIAVLLAQP